MLREFQLITEATCWHSQSKIILMINNYWIHKKKGWKKVNVAFVRRGPTLIISMNLYNKFKIINLYVINWRFAWLIFFCYNAGGPKWKRFKHILWFWDKVQNGLLFKNSESLYFLWQNFTSSFFLLNIYMYTFDFKISLTSSKCEWNKGIFSNHNVNIIFRQQKHNKVNK